MRVNCFFVTAIIATYLCSSCSGQTERKGTIAVVDSAVGQAVPKDISLPGGFSAQNVIKFDSVSISDFLNQYPGFNSFEKQIRQFYAGRKYAYAWYDKDGLIEQAGNLYNKIENIKDEGLSLALLYEENCHQMMEDYTSGEKYQNANTEIELMLTAQYFFYAKNVWDGMGAKAMSAVNWDLPQKKLSHIAMLDSLLNVPSSRFMTTEPVYTQYGWLKIYLKKYRTIERAGGWEKIKSNKKSYRMGDSGSVITNIRKRLFSTGDLAMDNQSAVFDSTLANAIKTFQQRYGFIDDGKVNDLLIAEMNYPVSKRIEQIIVNMERCRWIPVGLKKNYLVVNVPEYKLHAYENDSLIWTMNVVVGTNMNKTAIFNGMMNNVVFSPYWNIPPGIMKNETLPALKRDKNYLSSNHMEWNGKMVRQIPGPWNALGKVKFLFPNSHSIYLHDTPSKNAFKQERRAFSHGCIRVSDPKMLATYILRKQPEWSENAIDAAMNGTKEKYVKIALPVPVFIAYFTSWVDSKGRLNFRNDVYKRDSRLAKMIIENSGL